MAPPKKDAFSDLFNLAHGGLLRSSPSSSLNDLSQKPATQPQSRPSTTNNWANLDILSPNVGANANLSKPLNPLNANAQKNGGSYGSGPGFSAEIDPFSVFEKPSNNTTPNQALNTNGLDPFDFFEANSRPDNNRNQNQNSNPDSAQDLLAPKLPRRPGNDVALLDDEFTDAFLENIPDLPLDEPEPSVDSHNDEINQRDHVLAALMSEGFAIDIANKAIDKVGPDFEACTRLIVMSSVRPEQRRQNSTKDLGVTFQDMSSDLYKKASLFLDKSKKTVIKNINNLQNQRVRREGNDLPAWIASQHKYKDQAAERKKDGSSYEDYGSDDENIDTDEIRRIIQSQRQKEIERQRQRLESLGRSRSSSSSKSATPLESLNTSRNSPDLARVASLEKSRQASKLLDHRAHRETARSERNPESVLSRDSATNVPVSKPSRLHTATSIKNSAPEVDLLGLGSVQEPLSRAQRFKQDLQQEQSYVSPSRRRQPKAVPQKAAISKPRPAVSGPLNTFAQSDYETHKAKGSEAFSAGDYDNALNAYTKCLQSLPEKHELRIVITANLALTAIKIGNYRLASQNCEEGLALVGDHVADQDWVINDKNIKYWYVRLLARKAESLEMLENFPESLQCYMLLITKFGVNDKKTMDAKRRVNNIVNPPKQEVKSVSKPSPLATSAHAKSTKNLDQFKSRHMKEKLQEQQKFQLHDVVNERIQKWSHGKEDNLRSLLMSLSDVLPLRLGFPFITTKKITINDLMLTKKVKINYMKVISNIHPDKLGGYQLEDQMICQAVFVALNKAWDAFKTQNNIA